MWSLEAGLLSCAMVALWIMTGIFSIRRANLGRQLTFLLGTLVICPLKTFVLCALVFEQFFSMDLEKAWGVGAFAVVIVATIGGLTWGIWLTGFWISSVFGWWVRRKNVKA